MKRTQRLRALRFNRNDLYELFICLLLAGLFVMLSSGAAFGQGNVGINNATPHAKSLLDLTSNDKGLLTPRMTAAQRTAMFPVADATAKGMLVYQTDGAQGFYYYDGAAWVNVQNSGSGWSLTGDAGTTVASHFVGTTDNASVAFRTNNLERMRVSHTGNISIGAVLDPVNYRLYLENNSAGPALLTRNMEATGYAGAHMLNDLGTARAHIGIGNSAAPAWANMGYAGTTTAHPFILTTSDQERMRITESGNVGIGMVPFYNLDLHANNQAVARLNSGNAVNGTVIELKNSTAGDNTFGAINFNNAANSYAGQLSYHATNGMTFRSGGTERMRIAPSGNVGIGMAPFYNLDLHANNQAVARFNSDNAANGTVIELKNSTAGDNTFGAINFNNAANSYAGQLSYHGTNGMTLRSGGSERMRVATSGNVGIGNTAPESKLQVTRQAAGYAPNVDAVVTAESNGPAYFNVLSGNSESGLLFGANNNPQNGGIVYNTPSLPNGMVLRTGGNTNRMAMAANGHTTFADGLQWPAFRLGVINNSTLPAIGTMNQNAAGWSGLFATNSTDNAHSVFGFGNSGHALANTGFAGTYTNHPFLMLTGNTERMRIMPSGNVGIGTAAPATRLHVVGAQANGMAMTVQNTDATGWSGVNFPSNTGAGNASVGFDNASLNGFVGTTTNHPVTFISNWIERMRIAANGNVGIGTATPTTKLEVNGFTKLGTDAPAIKVKKLTGTTAATEGGLVDIAHGLIASKILSVQVLIEYTAGNWLGEAYMQNPEYQAHSLVMASNIRILNHATNSGNILSRPVKILVTYEE